MPDECCSERWTLTTYTRYRLHHTIVYSNLQFWFFCLGSQSFYKDVTEYFQGSVRWEQLQFLLSEDKPWENFVTEADLSRLPCRYTRNVTNMPQEDFPRLLSSRKILWLGARMFLLKILFGIFPPCYLLSLMTLGWEETKLARKGRLYDLGQVTELLSASSSVQFYCEDTEIMHASAFHDCWHRVGAQSMLILK